jgi:hypothetical protein
MALTVWNECRGLDWQALPLLVDVHGITDIETMIAELVAIREFFGGRDG